MNKSLLLLIASIIYAPTAAFADDLSWGDPTAESGQFKISGAIRTRYLSKDYQVKANEGSNNDWRLADIKLILGYENPHWIASADTRCYQYDELCDAVFLHTAWVGYKFTPEQRLTVGLQPIEFGFGEFWGNSYYETIMNTIGFEDVANLGIKYRIQHQGYDLSLAYYGRDGGDYKGTSKDASRYNTNLIEADDLTSGTNLREKNMWIARVVKDIQLDESRNLSTKLGASVWHSEIENRRTNKDGKRDNWNIFATTQVGPWQWMTLYGQQDIKNKDDLFPNSSTLGAFDTTYQMANKGSYIVNEINYSFDAPFHKITNIRPYLSHSKFFKDEAGYKDSERLIGGVAFNYKAIGVQAEYIMSRNDPMIGGDAQSLAEGNHNGWDKMLYLAVGYYF